MIEKNQRLRNLKQLAENLAMPADSSDKNKVWNCTFGKA